MADEYDAFVAGRRTDDVLIFLADDAGLPGDPDDAGSAAAELGEAVPAEAVRALEGGAVAVVPGEAGRPSLSRATGVDAMAFAGDAMDVEGEVERTLTRGTCPSCGETGHPRFLLAFAEPPNEDIGGLYAEGTVIHAYARCDCGADYSDRWVVDGDD